MNTAQRLLAIRERLHAACLAAERDPSQVHLVAVSKTFPAEALDPAYELGQRHFGENYAQELRDKAERFEGLGVTDLSWHFIGRLQSNKIKHIAPRARYVHAVEKRSHAEALAKHAVGPLGVFLSVNIGEEDSKGGVLPTEALARAEELDGVEGLDLCGLMCMPPRCEDPEDAAPYFARMAELAEAGRARGLQLRELSMGMSHDFHVAVRYGATFVRVGSAIFGKRS